MDNNFPIGKKMRNNTIIAISLFIAIFAGLVVIATFYDLEISKFLTKTALPAGNYISVNGFGLFFEAMGSAPMFIMPAIACIIALWFFYRREGNVFWSRIVPIGLGVVAVLLIYFCIHDLFKYVGEHMGDEEWMSRGYAKLLQLLLAAIIGTETIFLWKHIKPETNNILFRWALVIIASCVAYLIVHFVKAPVGRMRFRTMSAIGDTTFSRFTPWYEVNGKRALDGLPSDNCKSFPSGHTFSAGMIYTLLCLPALLPQFDKKGWRIGLWVGTVLYTALVAISRIVVGAHFMSDVLFGGTIAFVSVMLWREILIYRGAHFKSFKKTE